MINRRDNNIGLYTMAKQQQWVHAASASRSANTAAYNVTYFGDND